MTIAGRAAVSVVLVIVCRGLRAQDTPRVGVLLPTMQKGASPSPEPAFPTNKVPKKYREQMQAAVGQMADGMQQLHSQIFAQLPGIIQRTWIEMLERKGISAVALDADSGEKVPQDATSRNVRWILSSTVVAQMRQSGMGRMGSHPYDGGGGTAEGHLDVQFSLSDISGHVILPTRHATAEGLVQESSNGLGSGKDIWAECGDSIVNAVASTMPLGTIRHVDPSSRFPNPPRMTDSVRFDVTITDQPLNYRGEMGTGERAAKWIMEFADGAVAVQSERDRTGAFSVPDDPRMFLVDDGHRTFSVMNPSDLVFVLNLGAMGKTAGEPAPKLVRSGADAAVTHYKVERAQDAAAPSGTGGQVTTETSVDIYPGDPSPAWQRSIRQMHSLFSGQSGSLIAFGSDTTLSDAIWEELARSPAPPRRVVIRTKMLFRHGKKTMEVGEGTDIVFATTEIPKPIDFTIPRDYQWRSSPFLQMAFIP